MGKRNKSERMSPGRLMKGWPRVAQMESKRRSSGARLFRGCAERRTIMTGGRPHCLAADSNQSV